AERVSQKESLELDGSKLTITLKEIPKEISKDPNKLHVTGISEKTNKDGFESFMEVVSGVEVESFFFGSNYNAMVAFKEPPVLPKCKHKFCKKCIDLAFQHRKACPTCGMTYGVHTGNMPQGTMHHSLEPYLRLPGYERYGTVRIDYNFPSGKQGPEHPNPGQRYSGTSRTAYLPDCSEGREVLDLLQKAFNARLTFTIGRSVTTGVFNVVTWNDIHHKTNPYGGANG
ncbi:probable E3 ubiquitin-protein ligase DTX3, partial [Actinia tenebrosa]|uniref:E3 ubiquitin-protein ligase n=1 Tax=Actinia tenebrosa TaxID=6105 RepID=A0A6P8HJI7_ACTTE